MAELLNPYSGGDDPEERGSEERDAVAVNDLAMATMRELMSSRMRKRVSYVKFLARQRANKAMRSSS